MVLAVEKCLNIYRKASLLTAVFKKIANPSDRAFNMTHVKELINRSPSIRVRIDTMIATILSKVRKPYRDSCFEDCVLPALLIKNIPREAKPVEDTIAFAERVDQ